MDNQVTAGVFRLVTEHANSLNPSVTVVRYDDLCEVEVDATGRVRATFPGLGVSRHDCEVRAMEVDGRTMISLALRGDTSNYVYVFERRRSSLSGADNISWFFCDEVGSSSEGYEVLMTPRMIKAFDKLYLDHLRQE